MRIIDAVQNLSLINYRVFKKDFLIYFGYESYTVAEGKV